MNGIIKLRVCAYETPTTIPTINNYVIMKESFSWSIIINSNHFDLYFGSILFSIQTKWIFRQNSIIFRHNAKLKIGLIHTHEITRKAQAFRITLKFLSIKITNLNTF